MIAIILPSRDWQGFVHERSICLYSALISHINRKKLSRWQQDNAKQMISSVYSEVKISYHRDKPLAQKSTKTGINNFSKWAQYCLRQRWTDSPEVIKVSWNSLSADNPTDSRQRRVSCETIGVSVGLAGMETFSYAKFLSICISCDRMWNKLFREVIMINLYLSVFPPLPARWPSSWPATIMASAGPLEVSVCLFSPSPPSRAHNLAPEEVSPRAFRYENKEIPQSPWRIAAIPKKLTVNRAAEHHRTVFMDPQLEFWFNKRAEFAPSSDCWDRFMAC